MQVEVILFGQLTDIVRQGKILLADIADTDQMVKAIEQQYPAMIGIKYIIAADKKVISANTIINEKTELALLPPFSGG